MKKWMVILAISIFTITAAIPALGAGTTKPATGQQTPSTKMRTLTGPDLIVESVNRQFIKSEIQGYATQFTFKAIILVKNKGTDPAGSFKVCVEKMESEGYRQLQRPIIINSLDSGSTKTIETTTWTERVPLMYGGPFSKIRVTVDCENNVRETNEHNNEKVFQ